MFKVGAFEADDVSEQLLFEATLRDGEVDGRDFDLKFGQQVRIGMLRRHVEAETGIVVDVLIAETDEEPALVADGLAKENAVECCIDGFANIFEEDGNTGADAEFESLEEILVGLLENSQIVVAFHRTEPRVGLALRIEAETPAR